MWLDLVERKQLSTLFINAQLIVKLDNSKYVSEQESSVFAVTKKQRMIKLAQERDG